MGTKHIVKSVKVGDKELTIETGRLAKQADGATVIRYGDTVVLATAVSARDRKDVDFLPLTVEYKENLYAAGRIPGSYFKREGRLTEKETLTSRIVDRSCRPLFPDGYAYETQLIVNVVSSDGQNEPDVLALTAASAALWTSDIPFNGPIAGVRVGRVGGQFVVNPTAKQREVSDIDLVVACSKEAIVMVEGGANEISEQDALAALEFAHKSCQPLIQLQEQMRAELGVKEREFDKLAKYDAGIKEALKKLTWGDITKGYSIAEKHERYAFLKASGKKGIEALKGQLSPEEFAKNEKSLKPIYEDLKYEYMRELTTNGGRIGGRKHDAVRDIKIEVSTLPRTHGSAVFQRGETQALVTATLGTGDDVQRLELLGGDLERRFMLHYNFPPFSVNETKPLRGPGRREIGHGALAERALKGMVPGAEFPYVIRIVSDILESNGSSSMASVCGGTLALMDAGVPVKSPVAGIAMGLVKEGSKVAILTDILGDEDHLGDMDFKVCGTSKGITAVQMDIKITGLTTEIMLRAMEQARVGRLHILQKMAEVLPAPRKDISQYAPRIVTIQIKPDFIKNVIGPGGKVIKDIVARTGASVNIEDSGKVDVASSDPEAVKAAIAMIQALTREAEVGKIYLGTVRKVAEFGAFVELFPGTDGLIHISELSDKRVKQVTDVVKEGDEVMVKVISIDSSGKIRLSRKQALADRAAATGAPPPTDAASAPAPTTQA